MTFFVRKRVREAQSGVVALPRAWLIPLSVVFLTACAGLPTDESARSTAAAPVSELISSNQLPGGSKINTTQSLIMGSGDNWFGRVIVELSNSNTGYSFFLDQYPQQGWTLVSAVRGKSSLLVFTKPDRSATVEMVDAAGLASASATLTVSPKNSLPVAPKKP
jgi:hypothetical protein